MKNKKNIKSKYYVPYSYLEKGPTSYCRKNNSKNESNTCLLTKKEICSSIIENFIVRNNIIAAILTTIPQKKINKKNGTVFYEGGICFEQFLSLEKCMVCLPPNYRELSKKPLQEALPELLKTSKHFDKKSCNINNGIFMMLSNDEKKLLIQRSQVSEEELEINPHFKANKAYTEFMLKLKNKYFESLNALILILEKIKESPFVSNEMLNNIGLETKNIIDGMYNFSNYYYIFALLALIQSDYSIKNDKSLNQLSQVVSISKK